MKLLLRHGIYISVFTVSKYLVGGIVPKTRSEAKITRSEAKIGRKSVFRGPLTFSCSGGGQRQPWSSGLAPVSKLPTYSLLSPLAVGSPVDCNFDSGLCGSGLAPVSKFHSSVPLSPLVPVANRR